MSLRRFGWGDEPAYSAKAPLTGKLSKPCGWPQESLRRSFGRLPTPDRTFGVLEGMAGIYRADGTTDRAGVPLPHGPVPSQRTRRKKRALPIVRDEFRADYSSIGLLASRARLRFIDRSSLSGDLRLGRRNRTFLLCQQPDISTLP
jgi:hypothetical protein